MRHGGVIAVLVEALQQQATQSNATRALENMASGDDTIRDAIVAANAIAPLVRALEHGITEEAKCAARAPLRS